MVWFLLKISTCIFKCHFGRQIQIFFCIFRFFLTSIQILCQIKVAGLIKHIFSWVGVGEGNIGQYLNHFIKQLNQGWVTSGFIRNSGFFFFFLLSWKNKPEPGKLTFFLIGEKNGGMIRHYCRPATHPDLIGYPDFSVQI